MTLPFAATSPSEPLPAPPSARLQRTEGTSRISFKFERGATRLDRLHQSGASKIRLPHVFGHDPPQAVLINTAGGLTGGDRLSIDATVGSGCRAIMTTQACEKIYRSSEGTAQVDTKLTVARGARLDWLPQETILFDGARLARRLEADVAPGARLLLVEATIFGRSARGERVRSGLFKDRWRIKQGTHLLFADDLRFDFSDESLMSRPAILADGSAMATVLLVTDNPAKLLDAVRAIIGDHGGASAWDGKLVARIVADHGAALRRVLVPALGALLDGATLPRIWRM
jgi:urease accessory protein